MTVYENIKAIDKETEENKDQYNLDRKIAKISALSSRNLDNYEISTGKHVLTFCRKTSGWKRLP